jgi:hypothetical protein
MTLSDGTTGYTLKRSDLYRALTYEAAARFLACLTALHDAAGYPACFPYQSLLTEAPIQLFYTYYGLGEPH